MLDATRGAAQRLSGAIAQAQRRGHLSLEARCRVHLARTYVGGRRFDEAVAVLDALPAEGDRTLGPELRSQVHHWRGRARLAAGAADNADDAATARTLVTRIRDALPPALRTSFSARTDIAAIQ
jgi:thioredoxin-like negative regulator of GroEL